MKRLLALLLIFCFCWNLLEFSAAIRLAEKQEGWHCGQKLCLCQSHDAGHTHDSHAMSHPIRKAFKIRSGLPIFSADARLKEETHSNPSKLRDHYLLETGSAITENQNRFIAATFSDFQKLQLDHSFERPPRLVFSN